MPFVINATWSSIFYLTTRDYSKNAKKLLTIGRSSTQERVQRLTRLVLQTQHRHLEVVLEEEVLMEELTMLMVECLLVCQVADMDQEVWVQAVRVKCTILMQAAAIRGLQRQWALTWVLLHQAQLNPKPSLTRLFRSSRVSKVLSQMHQVQLVKQWESASRKREEQWTTQVCIWEDNRMLQIIIHLLPCSRCLLSSITSNLHTLTRVALRQLLTKVPPQLASNPKPMFGVNRTRLMTSQLKANQNPRRKIKVARARKRPPNHKKERWCLSQATTMMMK